MTTTMEPPPAELVLHAGEYLVQPDYCYGCGHTPCMWRYGGGDESLCLQDARPETLKWTTERMAARVVNREFDLPERIGDWLPGTGDMFRALAAELLEWADRADRMAGRAAQRREAGE